MTIVLLHFSNNSIEILVGGHPQHDRYYRDVTPPVMNCYKQFFRWAEETGIGMYNIYPGGWALQVEG